MEGQKFRFSENVLNRVMMEHGIKDREAFITHAKQFTGKNFPRIHNVRLTESLLTTAAEVWIMEPNSQSSSTSKGIYEDFNKSFLKRMALIGAILLLPGIILSDTIPEERDDYDFSDKIIVNAAGMGCLLLLPWVFRVLFKAIEAFEKHELKRITRDSSEQVPQQKNYIVCESRNCYNKIEKISKVKEGAIGMGMGAAVGLAATPVLGPLSVLYPIIGIGLSEQPRFCESCRRRLAASDPGEPPCAED